MIELLKMRAAAEMLVICVTFSNMWSMIRGRTGASRKGGTHFFVGGGTKEGRTPGKRREAFRNFRREIRPPHLPLLVGNPETITYINWPR